VAAAGVRAAGRASGAARHGPADRRARQHNAAQFGFKPNQKYFKRIQNSPNFDWFKMCFPEIQKYEIKYGWKEVEMRNNFLSRICLRFWMNFELKISELLWVEFQ
jgi:hypothetical protein